MAKEGSTVSGLMDSFATTVSVALQYGVPLRDLVNKFAHVRFEPSGFTGNQEIPIAKSIVDYIFRWLGSRFLSTDDKANLGLITQASYGDAPVPGGAAGVAGRSLAEPRRAPPVRGVPAPASTPRRRRAELPRRLQRRAPGHPIRISPRLRPWRHPKVTAAKAAAEQPADLKVLANGHSNGHHEANGNGHSITPKSLTLSLGTAPNVAFKLQGDAPSCAECGSIMVRNGSCYKCLNCGSTSGCS